MTVSEKIYCHNYKHQHPLFYAGKHYTPHGLRTPRILSNRLYTPSPMGRDLQAPVTPKFITPKGRAVYNPFDAHLLENLGGCVVSPNMFAQAGTPDSEVSDILVFVTFLKLSDSDWVFCKCKGSDKGFIVRNIGGNVNDLCLCNASSFSFLFHVILY